MGQELACFNQSNYGLVTGFGFKQPPGLREVLRCVAEWTRTHAYAVLGCVHDPVIGTRYVRVLNPWGRTGRGYTFAPENLEQTMSDKAVKRFNDRLLNGLPPERAYETVEGEF